jgi:PAS domain S-box-containing protein
MDSETPGEARGSDEGPSNQYRSIIEAVRDGIFVIDLDGTITYVNDSLCELTGHERDELLGETFDTLVESELVDPDAYERFGTAIGQLAAGDIKQETLTFELLQDNERVVDVHVSKHHRADDSDDIVGVVRDVTDREGRAQAAEQKERVLARLYDIGADASLTFEQKTERILAIGCEFLELPYGFLTRIEADVQQVVHTVGDHVLLQPGESAPLEKSYCRKTIESDDLVGMQDARAYLGSDDQAYQLFELGCYIGTKVMVGDTLFGTFCFAAPHDREREFTAGEREVIKLLGQWAGYELERQRFESRLQALHRISQQLLVAETTEAVATISLEMGEELFGLSMMAYWEYDADDEVLRPVAATDEAEQILGPNPAIERGEALVWESFDTGDIRSYGDRTDQPPVDETETARRAEVHVPCGTHGLITSSATEPDAFDEIDVESLRLLGALVTEAITAVKREQRIVERGEALQRQNERLDEFARVVAHDLRNPLAGAIGALEIVRETPEEEFFDLLDGSLERMNDLVDELLEIARGERQAVNARPLSLQSTVEEAWSYIDAPAATLTIADQLGEIEADETRLFQLFGNLFRNSVEHGGDDVTVDVGLLPEDDGFYVADDGPGLPAATRTAIKDFEERERVSELGIGFMSITDVVAEHGWDLSVCNPDEGVRIEIRTGTPDE